MGEEVGGTGKVAKTCNNKDHVHSGITFLIMVMALVVGGTLGWAINLDSGIGKPATMEVGKIYKVHAFVQLDKINWKEHSEGLLVKEEAQGAYPQFVEVPRSEVEGEIVVGEGIMGVYTCATVSCTPRATRYKTGKLSELEQLRKELMPK